MASQSTRRRKLLTWIQIWAGLFLGLAGLYLVARSIDLRELLAVGRDLRPAFVALTLGTSLLTPVLKAVRWRWLFFPQRPPLSLARLSSLIVIGQAVNFMIPGRWGELVRMYLTGEEAGVSKAFVLGTLAAEKALDLIVLAVLVVVLLPFVALPAGTAGRVEVVVLMAVAALAGAGALLGGRVFWLRLADHILSVLPPAPAARWRGRVVAGLDGLAALASLRAAGAIWGWTCAFWLVAGLTNLLLLAAFRLPPSALMALTVLAVLQGGVAVPSTPAKVGVFPLLCMGALSIFGIPEATGLVYGLVLHLLVVGGVSLWAAIALWRRSWSLSQLAQASAAWRTGG